jgi:hypothetical protein
MAAAPHVLVAEFRTADEEQAAELFAKLQALAEDMGVELVTAPWVDAEAYDREQAND